MMLTDAELKEMHHLDQFGLFCDYDEFEQIARAVIAANNAKVLADLKPDLQMVESPVGNFAPYYVHDGMVDNASANKVITRYYSGETVSALIQALDVLRATVIQLEHALCSLNLGSNHDNQTT